MARSFVVIGGGQQGTVVARALATGAGKPAVTVVDSRPAPAKSPFRWVRADALSREVRKIASDADACIVALPGDIADGAVTSLSRSGARVVDMSFVPEPDSPAMDRAARRAGTVLVRDAGVAPGLSHILAAALHDQLGGMDRLAIYVGGLPRRPPRGAFRHAVYFNALDLISEYTRPARMRRRGRDIAVDPLAPRNQRTVRDAVVGALDAFPSDGLRTLLHSFPACVEMEEMTLRWPGHLDEMRRMRAEGLLERRESGIGPATLTALALEEAFPGRDFPDLLLMEVHATRGSRRSAWRLLDRGTRGQTAMGRTTAFTAVAVARALAAGRFLEPGLHPPERLGRDRKARDMVIAGVRSLGIRLGRRALITDSR